MPLSNLSEINYLIKNGADELYCGVLTPQWKEKYSSLVAPNLESYPAHNLMDHKELQKAVKIAHLNGVKLFLTLNSSNYSKQQYSEIIKFAEKSDKWGVDGFIVANIGLCFYLNKFIDTTKLHLSIKSGVFNSKTIKFLHKEIGISRIVLPKQISINEIEQICKSKPKQVELSSFIIMGICLHCEPFCRFTHGIDSFKSPKISEYLFKSRLRKILIKSFLFSQKLSRNIMDNSILGNKAACCLSYDVISDFNNKKKEFAEEHIQQNLGFKTLWKCNVCLLYKLNKLGIKNIKIEGRGSSTESKITYLNFLKGLSNEINRSKSENDFMEAAKKQFNLIYGKKCKETLNCYYMCINRQLLKF